MDDEIAIVRNDRPVESDGSDATPIPEGAAFAEGRAVRLFIGDAFYPTKRTRQSRRHPHVGIKSLSMSRPLQSSFHLAMAARLCVHALVDRKRLRRRTWRPCSSRTIW
jgi:hypothetical protein